MFSSPIFIRVRLSSNSIAHLFLSGFVFLPIQLHKDPQMNGSGVSLINQCPFQTSWNGEKNIKYNQWRRGGGAIWKVRGLRGGTFFRATFYCVFGRFGKMTYLVNLKKWGGSSPLCPPWCGAPENHQKDQKVQFWKYVLKKICNDDHGVGFTL